MTFSKCPSLLLSLAISLLFLSSSSRAFNITRLLSQYPDFSNFNDLLTKTKLNEQINRRSSITVLALDNGAVSSLTGGNDDLTKSILSVHVILDYYDKQKLAKLTEEKLTQLTTLYQSSGNAVNLQGFVKVAVKDGGVSFGSAAKGAKLDSKLVKSVASQPYNISVLQISGPIGVPGLNADASSLSPSEAPAKAPAKSPKKAPSPKTPDVEVPVAEAPDTADAPAEAPAGDAPAKSPNEAPTPAADETATDTAPTSNSLATVSPSVVGCVGAVIGLMSFLVGF